MRCTVLTLWCFLTAVKVVVLASRYSDIDFIESLIPSIRSKYYACARVPSEACNAALNAFSKQTSQGSFPKLFTSFEMVITFCKQDWEQDLVLAASQHVITEADIRGYMDLLAVKERKSERATQLLNAFEATLPAELSLNILKSPHPIIFLLDALKWTRLAAFERFCKSLPSDLVHFLETLLQPVATNVACICHAIGSLQELTFINFSSPEIVSLTVGQVERIGARLRSLSSTLKKDKISLEPDLAKILNERICTLGVFLTGMKMKDECDNIEIMPRVVYSCNTRLLFVIQHLPAHNDIYKAATECIANILAIREWQGTTAAIAQAVQERDSILNTVLRAMKAGKEEFSVVSDRIAKLLHFVALTYNGDPKLFMALKMVCSLPTVASGMSFIRQQLQSHKLPSESILLSVLTLLLSSKNTSTSSLASGFANAMSEHNILPRTVLVAVHHFLESRK